MQRFATSLVGLSLLLAAPLAHAATVPTEESDDSIIRHGHDLDWNQAKDTEYEMAKEQKAFQEWMNDEYDAWKAQWREPLNPMNFAVQHRRARRMLTGAHREAVRTGEWDRKPLLSIGLAVRPTVEKITRTYDRVSRRQIVNRAEAQMRTK